MHSVRTLDRLTVAELEAEYKRLVFAATDELSRQAQEALHHLVHHWLQDEFERLIDASAWQRTPQRTGYRNGYRTRDLLTSFGPIRDIQVRRRTDPMSAFCNRQSAELILLAVFAYQNDRWKIARPDQRLAQITRKG